MASEEWTMCRLRRGTRAALAEWIRRTEAAAQRGVVRLAQYAEGMSVDDAVTELLCRDLAHRRRSRRKRNRGDCSPVQLPAEGPAA